MHKRPLLKCLHCLYGQVAFVIASCITGKRPIQNEVLMVIPNEDYDESELVVAAAIIIRSCVHHQTTLWVLS